MGLTPHKAKLALRYIAQIEALIKNKSFVIEGHGDAAIKIAYAFERTKIRARKIYEAGERAIDEYRKLPIHTEDGTYVFKYLVDDAEVTKEVYEASESSTKSMEYTFESDAIRDEYFKGIETEMNREYEEVPYAVKSEHFACIKEKAEDGTLINFSDFDSLQTMITLGLIDV